MNLARFDTICKRFPGTTMVIQWGNSHVHKIGGKMFALGGGDAGQPYFVFKTTPLSFEILLQQGIASRAAYLTRGNWVSVGNPTSLPDADLATYLRQSYDIVAGKLPKAMRQALGLI
jgi:predicted DNA-binding protein (MmcQ/YjbR family)